MWEKPSDGEGKVRLTLAQVGSSFEALLFWVGNGWVRIGRSSSVDGVLHG
jgi:hypothetical protein